MPHGRFRSVVFVASSAVGVVVATWAGCSSQGGAGFTAPPPSPPPGSTAGDDGGEVPAIGSSGGGGNRNPSGAFDLDASYPPPPCSQGDAGLAGCIDKSCGSSPTTLTGKVYDPAGKNPIYNVVVYVPRDPSGRLPPIATGTSSCNTCDAQIGDYVAVGLTDESGSFTLPNVPTGQDVPVVFQIGKWRSEARVTTTSCRTTAVPATQSRLPRNQAEGSLPQMAILTGGCDYLPCFMIDMGLDPQEFTGPGANGRLHVYRGDTGNGGIAGMAGPGPDLAGGGGGTAGDCTSSNVGKCPLWSQRSQLERYDIMVLSCECDTHDDTKPDKVPMHDWLNEGGKVFATHYHYTWFENGPTDFRNVANWSDAGLVLMVPGPFQADTSFPKGMSFNRWLGNVGALNANGTINLKASDVRTSMTTINSPSVRWIYDTSTTPNDVKYMSFGTPVGGVPPATDAGEGATPRYCGKAVLTDLHAGGGSASASITGGLFGGGGALGGAPTTVPQSCTAQEMTPQEKALEFLFFDLSACVQPDKEPPKSPPPPVQ